MNHKAHKDRKAQEPFVRYYSSCHQIYGQVDKRSRRYDLLPLRLNTCIHKDEQKCHDPRHLTRQFTRIFSSFIRTFSEYTQAYVIQCGAEHKALAFNIRKVRIERKTKKKHTNGGRKKRGPVISPGQ
ncbi:hypothetical protein AtNW77_Chr1g0080661 [Arabidopsis thaliana]|uniref:Uncharacterized protein n=2 Tax=Arabidopsis thaliana TaxID=3702 RepID=A0A654EV76_ARATH|nr:uncharacterized protein AT1G78476 [Arabidopsis thaliana]AEE36110.1 hypothetical protein AT1G78476 [Arabidopsis thaliana]CAA0341320.1 unnamed protein product [Arabidopsis thaliana]VYS51422.1 unnamed protein product [Arabidopsis thaliana]|eukprot:NP_001185426.1 hypothetical protein AT1G78476 [Arabidopsis thaliana]